MKVLVTGSTGLLAKGLEETAPAANIVGIHKRTYRVRDPRERHMVQDVCDRDGLFRLFEKENFDAVVHAAGLSSVDLCQRRPAEARESNLAGTRNVAEACKAFGAYMVYVSTHAVFDGKAGPYAEDAAPAPVHEQGRIKLECEAAAAAAGCFTVVRPHVIYGWNHTVSRPNLVTLVYGRLLRGERIQLADDLSGNPVYNRQCGRALWAILEQRPSGVFHLAGKTRLSRYQLGVRIAEAFGLDAGLIEPAASSSFKDAAPRPPDTTLATRRMQSELGVDPMPIEEGLADMKSAMGISL